MRNKEQWTPSKFVYRKKKLQISLVEKEVNIASRLVGKIIADFYDQNIKLYAKGKLLDLGCGKVPLYATYKDFITENICIDWTNTLHKNPYLDYELDLNEKLPLDSGEFDTIILSDVLEHIRKPEQLWQEMQRILKINGRLMMNVPFYYWLHEQPHDYFRYTEYGLRAMAEEAGFTILLLEAYGGIPEILTDICAKLVRTVPFVGKFMAVFIQKFTAFVVKTHLGRKASKATSRHFPFGYFLIAEKV